MSTAVDAPYGTWTSPVTADDLLRGALGLSNPRWHGGELFWMESRPAEGGRTTIVRRDAQGVLHDCVPPPFNVRTRVHEYGGICYLLHGRRLWFSNFADQRIHVVDLAAADAAPTPITPDDGRRWADFELDAGRRRLIAIGEADRDGAEARNFIAAIPLDGGEPVELVSGSDFYADARVSPDGQSLLWLEWDHPCMPWDGTRLQHAALDAQGLPRAAEQIAGGPEEAVFQPGWLPDGRLLFVSDRSGWWNLYLRQADGDVVDLTPIAADVGRPLWVFGMRSWAALGDGRILCQYRQPDGDVLDLLDPEQRSMQRIPMVWTGLDGLAAETDAPLPADGSPRFCFVGAGEDRFAELVVAEAEGDAFRVLRTSTTMVLEAADLSRPQAITFPTGPDGSAESHAFFYAPAHRHCRGAAGERPPLVVISHGGPTAATSPVLGLKVQYWTSRGFAVLDVDYRGSTGYGRAYRDALKGGWGVVDVEDCVAGARFLAERGDVDPQRMAIRGSSAGGLTVLGALTFHDLFRCGTSLYGVADLAMLARDTHKFESRYLDSLVGPWPQARDVYEARSPLHHTKQLDRPVLFLQGLEDRIVPPSQAEAMVAALDARGIPVAYITFEGEQHGFRQAANIRRALEAELQFYAWVFGFVAAGDMEPIEIRNRERARPTGGAGPDGRQGA